MMKPAKVFKKEQIRKASEIKKPPQKIVTLNPMRSANFTPKESIENMANPRIGKTKDIVDKVTELSYYFKYAAI